MTPKKLTDDLSVSPQILPGDVAELAAMGFKSIIDNRPDGEGSDQPSFAEIERAAKASGLTARYVPVESGKVSDADAVEFGAALAHMPKPILAYCRTGTRSTTLWALAEAGRMPMADILSKASAAGYDMSGVASRIATGGRIASSGPVEKYDIVIVGGGAAGAAVAGSLFARKGNLKIAIIDPADVHYYQPGWTLVGGGVFTPEQTVRKMGSVLPRKATWIKAAVAGFDPDNNSVVLEGCRAIRYDHLIVCPGLKLNWGGIEGLTETIGKNGVTSNYRYDLAPYTWELVKGLKAGRAIFTQPPMPIKCAGAPQKAMYLSADHWLRTGCLNKINIEFDNAGAVLFGVPDYVPALMNYIERYHVQLNFGHNLVSVDGPAKRARFAKALPDGTKEIVEKSFDMMHVCPPQIAPDFIRASVLADAAGWVDVDPSTLRHKTYKNIFGLGDATNTPNAKTAAAARKQAPVVAENVLHDMGYRQSQCVYDGYGSCPLTVERGKIVLAEFTYGGKLSPSFPSALLDGRKPSRAAWLLKERILPPIYWQAMLKGREWMAKPKVMA
ncbi:TIGR01244 family sulfur transferase [Hyphomicrobium sp. MC8b]|uniref:TIGR01244 family sulfur transferase n=1 Tax=Hyphomicrobium sp. MC8b TaxID=300273 RepID=UPI00391A0D59